MNPSNPTPSMMLPPSLLRGGQTTPGQLFQQNPLQQNMSPMAMGADPSVMQQPQAGSQANNPTMPGQGTDPMAGQQQANAQPGSGQPQISEAQYILNVLGDRLKHHSKITEKTVNTLSDMIAAGLPVQQDQGDPNAPVGA